jgi:hypothetical protein
MLTYIDEPVNWESAVATVEFQDKKTEIHFAASDRAEQHRRRRARNA